MRKRAIIQLAFPFLAALLVFPFAHSEQVTAAVAANFAAATKQIAPLFERHTEHELIASFGSTGKLYAQIINGAPFDVFLAADQRRPRRLEDATMTVPDTRVTYAVGKLVLWSAQPDLVDPKGAVLTTGEFERIAIANPRIAPYGAAAVEVMKKLGLWKQLAPRLVYGNNIAQAFQLVSTHNVPLGFVALAQVRSLTGDRRGSVWMVPNELYEPLRQDAVLLERASGNPAAQSFLEFLRGAEAQQVIEDLGYGLK